uniref:sigma-54-dependent Fis family transcriptional regulator n=1 Tax=Polynucleobacter sp. TaxID=2029855 RepID=UPI0040471D94
MQHSVTKHISEVVTLAERGLDTSKILSGRDEIIRSSWSRCVHEHNLDPTRMQEAIILPSNQLREHQDRMGDFLHIARYGLETLYQQVMGMGYCVLLTDANGITVDFIGDIQLDSNLRKAGLYLGSDWSEKSAGTCGVGTCIQSGHALTVHLDDHFDSTHIPLSCTSAPVFDNCGNLNAVLDVSQLSTVLPKESQKLAMQLVTLYAGYIENSNFMHQFRKEIILKLGNAPQFLDVNPDYLIALDETGRVIGHNRSSQTLFDLFHRGVRLIGMHFDDIFDAPFERVGIFAPTNPPDKRAIRLKANDHLLFMSALVGSATVDNKFKLNVAQANSLSLNKLCGDDPVFGREIDRVKKLVNTPISILLQGETGTGKEYFAKAIHQSSERKHKPFVAVNCAAIPETLIESELFGYTAGSFSGAKTKGKLGLIQEADGGTLFLDEIGDMPIGLQARLLRVLSEREILPIGATRPLPVNIRVISASHRDLEELIRLGEFRDDLYYRLNGAQVSLPPLRERKDKQWITEKVLHEVCNINHIEVPKIDPTVVGWMEHYRWPGNLRELKNILEFAASICHEGLITLTDLPDKVLKIPVKSMNENKAILFDGNDTADAALLKQYLRSANWNVSYVARQLDISRSTLYRRMEKFNIEPPNGFKFN